MAWSLFTVNADLKPLSRAVSELVHVGERIAAVLERRYPAPADRTGVRPAGPENWSVESPSETADKQRARRQEQILGRRAPGEDA